jgi:hypothetical protein
MKQSRWSLVIGVLLVIVNLLLCAGNLSNPHEIVRVNIAQSVGYILWIALGVFLIINYFKLKALEDAGEGIHRDNDIERLKIRRNKIFAYVLIIEIIGSSSYWILNNYTAGLTPVNISMIFDLLVNLVFVFCVFAFLTNKNILRFFLLTIIVYTIGGIVMAFLRDDWVLAVTQIAFGSYFIYAISTPLTLKNHRIANFIILPLALAITLIFVSYESGITNNMWQTANKSELEFTNATTDLSNGYVALLQDNDLEQPDFDELKALINRREEKMNKYNESLEKLKIDLGNDVISQTQIDSLKKINTILAVTALHKKQAEVLRELISYSEKIDFDKDLSDKQSEEINRYIKEIDNISIQISEESLKIKS